MTNVRDHHQQHVQQEKDKIEREKGSPELKRQRQFNGNNNGPLIITTPTPLVPSPTSLMRLSSAGLRFSEASQLRADAPEFVPLPWYQ